MKEAQKKEAFEAVAKDRSKWNKYFDCDGNRYIYSSHLNYLYRLDKDRLTLVGSFFWAGWEYCKFFYIGESE